MAARAHFRSSRGSGGRFSWPQILKSLSLWSGAFLLLRWSIGTRCSRKTPSHTLSFSPIYLKDEAMFRGTLENHGRSPSAEKHVRIGLATEARRACSVEHIVAIPAPQFIENWRGNPADSTAVSSSQSGMLTNLGIRSSSVPSLSSLSARCGDHPGPIKSLRKTRLPQWTPLRWRFSTFWSRSSVR